MPAWINQTLSHLVWTEFILENETFECKKESDYDWNSTK